jgi:hypothetical protein
MAGRTTRNGMAAIAAVLAASVSLHASAGGACRAQSGAQTVALIELYTSEGCSSCPPADRWLSRNVPPGAAADAVALAFHVDYWDRLGWKDRFASAAATSRQYDVMRMSGGRFVYTPQLVVGGRDYGEWRAGSPARTITAINARPARARIALDATVDGGRLHVSADATLDGAAPASRPALALALTGSGLVSQVTSGENAGARLVHDHVVRRFAIERFDGARGRANVDWALPHEAGHAPTLVAFVQDAANGDVLQAIALPLAGCAGR